MAGEQKQMIENGLSKKETGECWEAALSMKGLKRKRCRQKGNCRGVTVGSRLITEAEAVA